MHSNTSTVVRVLKPTFSVLMDRYINFSENCNSLYKKNNVSKREYIRCKIMPTNSSFKKIYQQYRYPFNIVCSLQTTQVFLVLPTNVICLPKVLIRERGENWSVPVSNIATMLISPEFSAATRLDHLPLRAVL